MACIGYIDILRVLFVAFIYIVHISWAIYICQNLVQSDWRLRRGGQAIQGRILEASCQHVEAMQRRRLCLGGLTIANLSRMTITLAMTELRAVGLLCTAHYSLWMCLKSSFIMLAKTRVMPGCLNRSDTMVRLGTQLPPECGVYICSIS